MKKCLVAILKHNRLGHDKLDAADRAYLSRWADNCAEDPIWEEIVADARAKGALPPNSLHLDLMWYALQARRAAESVRVGYDPSLREDQEKRARLLELATKAEDLARYYHDVKRYSGICSFIHRHFELPLLPEQKVIPRIEPTSLRVQQLQEVHEREAVLLRQLAGSEPKQTIFISRKKGKRQVTAFVHLMTGFLDEMCSRQHRNAVAILASMAFDSLVDNDDVRRALGSSTRGERLRRKRAFKEKKS